jgi:hypothetical protein
MLKLSHYQIMGGRCKRTTKEKESCCTDNINPGYWLNTSSLIQWKPREVRRNLFLSTR